MFSQNTTFSTEQRNSAIQRLTALWAFVESGLGGVLHALQAPFTGLIVGGMAVLLVTLIAWFAQPDLHRILHSTIIVLIVKAMASPHTPVPAFFAVSFQGLLGFGLFYLFRINLISILLLSVISMLESAIQKLLILALFFGNSLRVAAKALSDYITQQMGVANINGLNWMIGIYLLIYFAGGILVAWMAYRTIQGIFRGDKTYALENIPATGTELPAMKKSKRNLWILIILLTVLAVLLYVFAADSKSGWIAVIKALTWTTVALLLWYGILNPLLTGFIQKLLKKKESRYGDEINGILSFFPELKQFSLVAWQESRRFKGLRRLQFFSSVMVHWSLTGLANEPTIHSRS